MRPSLLEREGALGRIDDAIGAARGGSGGVLTFAGPLGIGKTALLRELIDRARAGAVEVLFARGGELERDFAFGVVRQLFDPQLAACDERERAALLSGAAGAASGVLGLPAPAGAAPAVDPVFAALHGLYWLAAALAERSPLVVAVDDVDWCDEDSRRWLLFLARRIDALPILLVLATGAALDVPELAGLPHAERIEPQPLSEAAVGRLLADATGAPPEPSFARACAAATGGNPYLIAELVRILPARELASTLADVGEQAISRATSLRLTAISPDAVALARAAAVLGSAVPLQVAARLAELPAERAAAAADGMAAAGLLARTDPLTLAHPLLRSALYGDLAAGERAAAHARAADVMAALDRPAHEIAAQLLRTTPAQRPETVATLRDAARAALLGGAPATAARYLVRADAEPPIGLALRAEVSRDLGLAELLAHDPGGAAHLQRAIELSDDPRFRAETAQRLARALLLFNQIPPALALLQRAFDELGPDDRELQLGLASDMLLVGRLDPACDGTATRSLARVRALMAAQGGHPESGAVRLALAELALHAATGGAAAAEAVALADRALAGGKLLRDAGPDSPSAVGAVLALIFADRLDEARAHLDAAVADARARGSVIGFEHAMTYRALLVARAGALADAEADARAALDASDRTLPPLLPLQIGVLVDALMERGAVADAESLLAEHGFAGDPGPVYQTIHLLIVRGQLRLLDGRPGRALADFLSVGRRQQAHDVANPAVAPWRSGAALAHHALGNHADAAKLADEEVELAHAFGAARALGIALRTAGLIHGSSALLAEAAAATQSSPARLVHARTLTDLGAALRRARRRGAAREPLLHAVELADTCGASALADRARTELEACGVRPRGRRFSGADALTASERRIAAMAAEGFTNRDIAQALFVTTRTVESHLANSYSKLGIHARADLPAALAGSPKVQ